MIVADFRVISFVPHKFVKFRVIRVEKINYLRIEKGISGTIVDNHKKSLAPSVKIPYVKHTFQGFRIPPGASPHWQPHGTA